MGYPRCYGVRTLVEETGSVVKISVLQGSLLDAPETCTAVGVQDSFSFFLDKPLDGRKIESLDPPATELHKSGAASTEGLAATRQFLMRVRSR